MTDSNAHSATVATETPQDVGYNLPMLRGIQGLSEQLNPDKIGDDE